MKKWEVTLRGKPKKRVRRKKREGRVTGVRDKKRNGGREGSKMEEGEWGWGNRTQTRWGTTREKRGKRIQERRGEE